MFPNLDFGYSYNKKCEPFLKKWFDEEEFQPSLKLEEGDLVPSWQVEVDGKRQSLRKLLADLS